MIKKILFPLLSAFILVYIIMYSVYNGDLSKLYYANAFFVTGVIYFSVGLITFSNAGKIFRGIGFVLKQRFTHKVDGLTYFDYVLLKEEKVDKNKKYIGLPTLFIGIAFIIIAIILSY